MTILYVAAGVFAFAVVAAVILELLGWAAGGPEEQDNLGDDYIEWATRPHGNVDRL